MKCDSLSAIQRKAFWAVFFGAATLLHTAFFVLVGGVCAGIYYEASKHGKNLPFQSASGWAGLYLCVLGIILLIAHYAAQSLNVHEHQTDREHELKLQKNIEAGFKVCKEGNIFVLPSNLVWGMSVVLRWLYTELPKSF